MPDIENPVYRLHINVEKSAYRRACFRWVLHSSRLMVNFSKHYKPRRGIYLNSHNIVLVQTLEKVEKALGKLFGSCSLIDFRIVKFFDVHLSKV